jgi:hypothetical protein
MPLQLKKILNAKAPDVPLQAEDIIFVPGSAAKGAANAPKDANAVVHAAVDEPARDRD